MGDLRSEIEARKSRIAELKRQREALALGGLSPAPASAPPAQAAQFSFVHPSGPQIEIEAPFLYSKQVQTEPVTTAASSIANHAVSVQTEETTEPSTEPAEQATEQGTANDTREPEYTVVEPFLSDPMKLTPSLVSFLDNSWRAVARSSVAAVQDYTATASTDNVPTAGSSSLETAELVHELASASTLVSWSPHFEELFITLGSDERRACLWSLDALTRPEFTVRSPTRIKKLLFSPHSAQYVYGGGANGQLFVWDLKDMTSSRGARFDLLPQLKSPIENSPVVSLAFVGPNLVSLNEDGILEVWNTDSLSRPRHYILLEDRLRSSLNALKITSPPVPTAMAAYETLDSAYGLGYGIGACVIGTIQGHLLRVPAQPGSEPRAHDWRHMAPVSCLNFRKLAPVSTQDAKKKGAILASGGLDWKLRIWFVPDDEAQPPVEVLRLDIDFTVADVAWHPTSPSVLAAVGDSRFQVWNLDVNALKPVFSTDVDDTLHEVAFSAATTISIAGAKSVQLFHLKQEDVSGSDNWFHNLYDA